MLTCEVSFIDCNGKETPHDLPVPATVIGDCDGQPFLMCDWHAQVIRTGRCHAGNCQHATGVPPAWTLHLIGPAERR